jgi:hypothetical protein
MQNLIDQLHQAVKISPLDPYFMAGLSLLRCRTQPEAYQTHLKSLLSSATDPAIRQKLRTHYQQAQVPVPGFSTMSQLHDLFLVT